MNPTFGFEFKMRDWFCDQELRGGGNGDQPVRAAKIKLSQEVSLMVEDAVLVSVPVSHATDATYCCLSRTGEVTLVL